MQQSGGGGEAPGGLRVQTRAVFCYNFPFRNRGVARRVPTGVKGQACEIAHRIGVVCFDVMMRGCIRGGDIQTQPTRIDTNALESKASVFRLDKGKVRVRDGWPGQESWRGGACPDLKHAGHGVRLVLERECVQWKKPFFLQVKGRI